MYVDIAKYLSSADPSFGDLKKSAWFLITKKGKPNSYFDAKFLKEVKNYPESKKSPLPLLLLDSVSRLVPEKQTPPKTVT